MRTAQEIQDHKMFEEYNACVLRKAYYELYKDDPWVKQTFHDKPFPPCFPVIHLEEPQLPPLDEAMQAERIFAQKESDMIKNLQEHDKMLDAQARKRYIKSIDEKVQYFKIKEQEIINEFLKDKVMDEVLKATGAALLASPHPITKIMGLLIESQQIMTLGDTELDLLMKSTMLLKEKKQFCNYIEENNDELIPIPSICIEE